MGSLSARCIWGFLLEPYFCFIQFYFVNFLFSSFLPFAFILLFLSQLSQKVLFSLPHIWSRPSLFQFAVAVPVCRRYSSLPLVKMRAFYFSILYLILSTGVKCVWTSPFSILQLILCIFSQHIQTSWCKWCYPSRGHTSRLRLAVILHRGSAAES